MPNWKEIYKGGGFMTLSQLGNRTVIGEVNSCEVREREIKGKTQTKLEMMIDGLDNPIILNQDSCKAIALSYGEDSDDWVGKKVKARKGKVNGQGKLVDGILVTPTEGKGKK